LEKVKTKRTRVVGTLPERVLRSHLWGAGFRYRVEPKTLVGRPDVVFLSRRVAVFVDGCFWHGCPVHYRRPKVRPLHWAKTLCATFLRDRRQTLVLEAAGWRVVRILECEVISSPQAAVEEVRKALEESVWVPRASLRVFRQGDSALIEDESSRLELLRRPGQSLTVAI
jgi:DNA mismatch endonuclease (patch repair protein)